MYFQGSESHQFLLKKNSGFFGKLVIYYYNDYKYGTLPICSGGEVPRIEKLEIYKIRRK